jgi:hypothetical protein
MRSIEKLVSIGSEALGTPLGAMPEFLGRWRLGPELFELLKLRNGFYAFESALHVFPITEDSGSGLEGWNAEPLWRGEYGECTQGLLFFAEDIFQDQFCLREDGVFRFYAETGETALLAPSIEAWAELILDDYREQTGWPLAHDWQAANGPLPRGKRLIPKIPFVLSGEYAVDNLWAGNPIEGLSFKASIYKTTRDLPDGTKLKLKVKEWNRTS